MRFWDFDLELFDHRRTESGAERFRVRAHDQSVTQAEEVEVPEGLAYFRKLARPRAMPSEEFERACRRLGELLLPARARERLATRKRRISIGPENKLRLLLRSDCPALSRVPWEFAYLDDDPCSAFTKAKFLTADPNVVIVRFDAAAAGGGQPIAQSSARFGVVFASAQIPGMDKLDLEGDRQSFCRAWSRIPGVPAPVVIDDVSPDRLGEQVRNGGVGVFHFSGHAVVRNDEGMLLIAAGDGTVQEWPARQLALQLQGRGVRLAVLAACETAAVGESPWSNVALSLLAAGIPAVVGMQYKVGDKASNAFVERFYRMLAQRRRVEEALAEARQAILEDDESVRDIGAPVLYLLDGEIEDAIRFGDDGARRAAPGLKALLAQRLKVAGDYKDVHDKLHVAKCVSFAEIARAEEQEGRGGLSTESLLSLAVPLIGLPEDMLEIRDRGRCRAAHLDPLIADLQGAAETLERWRGNTTDTDLLSEAVRLYESRLNWHLSKINVVLQGCIDNLPDVAEIRGAGGIALAEQDEICRTLVDLRRWAARQQACEQLENLLRELNARKELDARTLRRRFDGLARALAEIVEGWDEDPARKLQKASSCLGEAVHRAFEAGEASSAGFMKEYYAFDRAAISGYFLVDKRLKRACGSNLRLLGVEDANAYPTHH